MWFVKVHNDSTCLLSNHSRLVKGYSPCVLMVHLRVDVLCSTDGLDLPELLSIQMGYSSFVLSDVDWSTLIMRSDVMSVK